MTRAFNEIYLDDAMNNLGDMFDYAVNDCGYEADDFFERFIISGVADMFEKGNPKYVSGLSGPELASEILYRTEKTRPGITPGTSIHKSAEYWAGWALAYFCSQTKHSFSELHRKGLTMQRLLSLYPTLHEADISKFADVAEGIINKRKTAGEANLKRIRMARGLTQKELAAMSGVSLRMIQLYEQRQQDINKAQVSSIAAIARVLGCKVDDLLE